MSKEVEIWKDIPGYEGLYQVSNLGRVKSLPREICNSRRCYISKERVLKNVLGKTGYFKLQLYKYGKVKYIQLHQLVAMVFLNHSPNGHNLVVDHINNNKLDNRVDNLQIVTTRKNLSKDKKGTSKYTGVSLEKKNNRWRSQINVNGKVKYLGKFNCELAASYAYQKALKDYE